jgi:DNA-binding transcriptional regulator Cro
MTNLRPAIDHFGSIVIIAKTLKLSTMAIYQWKRRGIPTDRALELAALSDGAFRAYDILKHPMLENIR